MKDRAVPVWHLQTAQNKTSFLCCGCEEKLEGVVGPEPAHRISRGVIRQQPAISILQKTSSQDVNSQSAYSLHQFHGSIAKLFLYVLIHTVIGLLKTPNQK